MRGLFAIVRRKTVLIAVTTATAIQDVQGCQQQQEREEEECH